MEAISRNNKDNKNNDRFSFSDIKKFLIEKFLYDNDTESLNILLNIYEFEGKIDNINPAYLSLKHLKKDIIKFLEKKEGKELISYNLSNLIYPDINRFELYLYLEGYRAGAKSIKAANILEKVSFKYIGIEELYVRQELFNYDIKNNEVLKLKQNIINNLRRDNNVRSFIYDSVFKFNIKFLKRKIFKLNDYLDKQLILNFDIKDENSDKKFMEMNSHLSRKDLAGLNKKIVKFLYRDGMRVFENAFWNGLNDNVMKRYK